jgi:hypothetical protein
MPTSRERSVWLVKRDDEKCSGSQMVLRQGGGNVSSTPCLGHKVVEDTQVMFFKAMVPYIWIQNLDHKNRNKRLKLQK